MELTGRSYITAGIALAAASTIAAGPAARYLPDLHGAQQLAAVSVSDIQLTDAASGGMVDLFAGVEDELASLAGGASATAVPADALSDILSPITQNLIVQTWQTTFEYAGTNLQYIFNQWSKAPFPVLQQVAANGIQYASDYVGAYQGAASGAVYYFTNQFASAVQTAVTQISTGQVSQGVQGLYLALFNSPFLAFTFPLESILKIPAYVTQNLANAMNYLTGDALEDWPSYVLQAGIEGSTGLGTSLQAVYSAWAAGDQLGAVTNLLNTPGAVTNALVNGTRSAKVFAPTGGLLSSPGIVAKFNSDPTGLLNELFTNIDQTLANTIVAPNAQNIVSGGSLATAFQSLVNQFINGWPTPTAIGSSLAGLGSGLADLGGYLGNQLSAALQSLPSILANLPSMIGSWIAALLRLL